jgi:hypothetical protein
MRLRWTAAALAAALAAAGALAAGPEIRLAAATRVNAGEWPLDVEVGHATPNVVDWDGDGRKDLLVGQFGGGKLRVYLNRGTDAAPAFGAGSYVQAGGKDASVPVS